MPSPEELVLYSKDRRQRSRRSRSTGADQLNAVTIGARLRYAHLLHAANVDDDVKVLVIRGAGDDFGTGADLPELAALQAESPDAALSAELGTRRLRGDVPAAAARIAPARPWPSGTPTRASGCRTLADFKKISIVEVKGYCYGWHFYQAADADLVIASDDALFGHPAFRYVGWGPRMWAWAMTMGIRKFQEMVFTGRPFTADEMYDCDFVNSVVPRDELEAEVAKYAVRLLAFAPDRCRRDAEVVLPDDEAVPGRVPGQPADGAAGVDGQPGAAGRPGADAHAGGVQGRPEQRGEGQRRPVPAGVPAEQVGPQEAARGSMASEDARIA